MGREKKPAIFSSGSTQGKPRLKASKRTLILYLAILDLFWISAAGQTTSGETALGELHDSGASSGKVILTPEKLIGDYSSFRRPSVRWLPNSKQLVLFVEQRGGLESESWIEIVDAEAGRRQRLIQGTNPQPSPDGLRIAYVAGEKENVQLWLIPPQGGTPTPLMKVPGAVGPLAWPPFIFRWSPDSRKIAYAFRPRTPEQKLEQRDGKASSVVVIGERGDVPPDSEIWVLDVETKSSQKMTSGPYIVMNLSWFPDGKALLFTVLGSFEYRRDDIFGEVRSIAVDTGEIRTLIKDGGVQQLNPSLSPDGKQIGFTYDPANLVFPYHLSVATIPAQGGAIRQLTHDIFVNSGLNWSRDGKAIYFTRKDGAFSQICFVTTEGEVKQLTRSPREASGVTISPNSESLAWTSRDAQGRVEVRVARSDGKDERVLIDLAPEVKSLALGEAEEIRWRSRDGLEIAGLVVKPIGYEPGKKYPLLVDLHGGPLGGIYHRGSLLLTSPLEWHMWASKGFVVFVPDYRSSVIYGWDQVLKARERQDANDRDFDDIMSGVDHVIQMGLVDPEKLALFGHSYGALLTNWIITRTDRFKVAVSKEGVVEMYLAYGTGLRVGGNSIAEWLFKGKPWEVPDNYRKNSAIEDLKRIKTPTLLISGDTGGVPLYHNEFLYTALKKQGVETKFLVYKGEGHGVPQRPENQRDLLMRVLDWIDSHLK